MPSPSLDLIHSSLHNAFGKVKRQNWEGKSCNLQDQLHASAKQILLHDIEYVKSNCPQSFLLDNLKSKYVQINCSKKGNEDVSSNISSVLPNENMAQGGNDDRLEEPRVTLWPLDKVTLGWRKNFPPGAGFSNLGNTCYMNSSLQALFHIPSMVNWLLEEMNMHITSCEMNSQNASFCSICSMMKTLRISLDRGNSIIKPSLIHNKLKCIGKTLMYGRQEDAHEFIKMLLDHMNKSFLVFKRALKLDHRSKETTPLNQIFGGYLRQQVICPLCSYVSTTFSHFQDIVLDIRSVGSVEEALALYFRKETIDSDNAYKCEKCRRKVPATKRYLIERAPHVLLLQLKRFTMSGGKITKHINIEQKIDISKYVNGANKYSEPYSYKLVSMVIHIGGSQHGGHYTAIAESSSNTMYEFDDSMVRPVSLQSALLRNPYILFYELIRHPTKDHYNNLKHSLVRQNSDDVLASNSRSKTGAELTASLKHTDKYLQTSLSSNCLIDKDSSSASSSSSNVIGDPVKSRSASSVMNGVKQSVLFPNNKGREQISFGIKTYSKSNGIISNNNNNKRILESSKDLLLSSKPSSNLFLHQKPSTVLVPYNDYDSDDSGESSKSPQCSKSAKLPNGESTNNSKKEIDFSFENSKNSDIKSSKFNKKYDDRKSPLPSSPSPEYQKSKVPSQILLPRNIQRNQFSSSSNSNSKNGSDTEEIVAVIKVKRHLKAGRSPNSNDGESAEVVVARKGDVDTTQEGMPTKKSANSSHYNGINKKYLINNDASLSSSSSESVRSPSSNSKSLISPNNFRGANGLSPSYDRSNDPSTDSKKEDSYYSCTNMQNSVSHYGKRTNSDNSKMPSSPSKKFKYSSEVTTDPTIGYTEKNKYKDKHQKVNSSTLSPCSKISSSEMQSHHRDGNRNVKNKPSTPTAVDWDRNVKDLKNTLSVNKNKSTDDVCNKRSAACWNGSNDTTVVNSLKYAGEWRFGSAVETWDGRESLIDQANSEERMNARKKSADDVYNEELDKGRLPKYKKHSPNTPSGNPFQNYQDHYINTNSVNRSQTGNQSTEFNSGINRFISNSKSERGHTSNNNNQKGFWRSGSYSNSSSSSSYRLHQGRRSFHSGSNVRPYHFPYSKNRPKYWHNRRKSDGDSYGYYNRKNRFYSNYKS